MTPLISLCWPQVFSEPRAQVQRMVGLDNPGISSAVAHRVHSKQGIYS